MSAPTVLIVPGLRDHVADHWQTLLAARLPRVRTVPPMGREDLSCAPRVAAIETELSRLDGPVILVAHSGGVITVVHWAKRHRRAIAGALLATPPDFESRMPAGYPTIEDLDAGGWLPVPREPLPFPSIVAASRNDPLASLQRVRELAQAWGSRFVDVGSVGHLNPASGFGEWPQAEEFVRSLAMGVAHA
jgi:predicted alpha/beta hydrolase family esterase